jgi:protein-tyrosine phosphatase
MTSPVGWIPEIAPLRLVQMPRPRSGDWLADEIAGWQRAGVNAVVSLLETHEARELDLAHEPSLCRAHGMDYLNLPIPDHSTPRSQQAVDLLVDDVVARLRCGEGVVVHCMAGIGRSGVVCACVLLRLGIAHAEVFPMLSRARRLTVPDTMEQIEWVRRYAAQASPHARHDPRP